MKYWLTFTAFLFLLSCGEKITVEQYWNRGVELRQNKKHAEALQQFQTIRDKFQKDSKAAEAMYQIADIYLNDVKDPEIAIIEFKKILERYPDTKSATDAMFMIGYVNANVLQAFSDAAEYYKMFLNKFPEHELVPSVQYELEEMGSILHQIDSLSSK